MHIYPDSVARVADSKTLDRTAYEPHIDYRKKRGLIEEINRAVQDVEEEVAARKAIAPPRQVEAGSIDTPREP